MTLKIILQTQRYKCIRKTKTGAKYKYTGRCDLGHIDRTGEGGQRKIPANTTDIENTQTGDKYKDRSQMQIQRQEPNTNTNTGVIWASGRGWEMGSRPQSGSLPSFHSSSLSSYENKEILIQRIQIQRHGSNIHGAMHYGAI